MFKPRRVLQVAVILLLAGCASSRQAPLAQSEPAPAGAGKAASVPEYPRRPAGGRQTGPDAFTLPDGSLKPEVLSYARETAAARGIPPGYVQALLEDARYDATVARLMSPAKTRVRRSWVTYRKRFVEPVRIRAGARFWKQHRATLDAVSAKYGVPPSIIVAIIGVETIYGRNTGGFSVLDSLATLAFRYPDPDKPQRSQLFRDQLADLIELDYRKELDARQASGSFAGAMGLPQFMPGSLKRYAADGDADGRIDLESNPADAIASVANFLVAHGWQRGLPVFAPATLPAQPAKLAHGGLEPAYDWTQLRKLGAAAPAGAQNALWTRQKLGVVDLVDEPRKQVEYRIGTPNFFAITHYNRSYFYAASVADLARALARQTGYGGPD